MLYLHPFNKKAHLLPACHLGRRRPLRLVIRSTRHREYALVFFGPLRTLRRAFGHLRRCCPPRDTPKTLSSMFATKVLQHPGILGCTRLFDTKHLERKPGAIRV